MSTSSKRSADETAGGNANKKSKPAGGGQVASRHCCICIRTEEDNDEENFLLPFHNCPTCVRGAWDICEECDDSCLSRQCPICRNNYAPRILFRTPQFISVDQIVGQDVTAEQSLAIFQNALSSAVLARQVAVLARLITSSNVAVYFQNRMHFFLPASFVQDGGFAGTQSTEFRSLSASVPMNDDVIDAEGRFMFTNDTWDALENEMEGEGEGDDEEEEGEEEEGEEGGEQENGANDGDAPVAASAAPPAAAAAAAQEGDNPPAGAAGAIAGDPPWPCPIY